ncbi:uncharacterized protein LOC113789605 [Dermatophagoides pteronyssinus]|uniref:uncharacterized protein LOC113789605 n=1 Tax=Dermatophagoides pteronyssinus TaxID=6956 RepID=UPI003F676364
MIPNTIDHSSPTSIRTTADLFKLAMMNISPSKSPESSIYRPQEFTSSSPSTSIIMPTTTTAPEVFVTIENKFYVVRNNTPVVHHQIQDLDPSPPPTIPIVQTPDQSPPQLSFQNHNIQYHHQPQYGEKLTISNSLSQQQQQQKQQYPEYPETLMHFVQKYNAIPVINQQQQQQKPIIQSEDFQSNQNLLPSYTPTIIPLNQQQQTSKFEYPQPNSNELYQMDKYNPSQLMMMMNSDNTDTEIPDNINNDNDDDDNNPYTLVRHYIQTYQPDKNEIDGFEQAMNVIRNDLNNRHRQRQRTKPITFWPLSLTSQKSTMITTNNHNTDANDKILPRPPAKLYTIPKNTYLEHPQFETIQTPQQLTIDPLLKTMVEMIQEQAVNRYSEPLNNNGKQSMMMYGGNSDSSSSLSASESQQTNRRQRTKQFVQPSSMMINDNESATTSSSKYYFGIPRQIMMMKSQQQQQQQRKKPSILNNNDNDHNIDFGIDDHFEIDMNDILRRPLKTTTAIRQYNLRPQQTTDKKQNSNLMNSDTNHVTNQGALSILNESPESMINDPFEEFYDRDRILSLNNNALIDYPSIRWKLPPSPTEVAKFAALQYEKSNRKQILPSLSSSSSSLSNERNKTLQNDDNEEKMKPSSSSHTNSIQKSILSVIDKTTGHPYRLSKLGELLSLTGLFNAIQTQTKNVATDHQQRQQTTTSDNSNGNGSKQKKINNQSLSTLNSDSIQKSILDYVAQSFNQQQLNQYPLIDNRQYSIAGQSYYRQHQPNKIKINKMDKNQSNELKRQLLIHKMGAKISNNNNNRDLLRNHEKLIPNSSNQMLMMTKTKLPETKVIRKSENNSEKQKLAFPLLTIDSNTKKIKRNRLMTNVKSLIKVINRFKSK